MAPRFQHNPVVRLCRSSASTANAPFPSPAAIAVSLSMPPALLHVLAWAGDRPPAFLSGHPHGSLREPEQTTTSSSRGRGPSPDDDPGPSSSGGRGGGSGGPASPSCFFFAYGSSLHRENLVGRDIRVQSRVPATVRDPSVHLVFRHRGEWSHFTQAGHFLLLDGICISVPSQAPCVCCSCPLQSRPSCAYLLILPQVAGHCCYDAGLIPHLSLPPCRSTGGGATLLRQGDGDPPPRFSPPDARVHGVLYRLDPAELSKLRRREAGYELTQVEVRARGNTIPHTY